MMTTYRVGEGDKLSSIARRFSTTTDAIVHANPARGRRTLESGELVFASLGAGDELFVPMLGAGEDNVTITTTAASERTASTAMVAILAFGVGMLAGGALTAVVLGPELSTAKRNAR